MQQTHQVTATPISDSEKLETILKQLELLVRQVEEIRQEMLRLGAHYQPLIQ